MLNSDVQKFVLEFFLARSSIRTLGTWWIKSKVFLTSYCNFDIASKKKL